MTGVITEGAIGFREKHQIDIAKSNERPLTLRKAVNQSRNTAHENTFASHKKLNQLILPNANFLSGRGPFKTTSSCNPMLHPHNRGFKSVKMPVGKRPVTSVINELAYEIRDAFIVMLRWTLGPRQRDTCPINNTNAGSNCILQCGMIIDRG